MQSGITYEDFLAHARGTKRPLRGSALMWIILAVVASFLVWASVTEVDEVTRGEGRIIASRQLQKVQSLEGGIIRSIKVTKGEVVEAGTVLVELDATVSLGELDQMRQKRYALIAEISRLTAEIHNTALSLPPEIDRDAPAIAITQRRLYEGRKRELSSQIDILRSQYTQRKIEAEEARSTLRRVREEIEISQAQINLIEPLVKRGIEPELSLLQQRAKHTELLKQHETAEHKINISNTALRENEEQQRAVLERFRSEALKSLSVATSELAQLEKTLPAREDRHQRTEIRSPVRGTVNRVLATTVGGVVAPGEPIAEIVPLDDALVVEAHILPADIAFLSPGQTVKVKLTAYDFARYGALDGKLMTIGADAIELPENKMTVYPVQIEVQSTLRDANGEPLRIIPGMVAQVDILTGRRTILDYMIEPVVKMKSTAFRES